MSKMSYQDAKAIRKHSFADLMTEKLREGSGVGSSFKQALSEKTKAKMTGLKETFDPMNIAKFMTGGSRLAPALVGKLMGRSKEDTEYFAGKAKPADRQTATKVDSIEQTNEMTDILLKIYTFMQETFERDKKLREEENNFKEAHELEKERRHKALLDALRGGSGKAEATATKTQDEGIGLSDIIERMKSLKDMLGGLSAAASITAGIAVIGSALSYFATGTLASPGAASFRKSLQDNPMLGAMSGDSALAAGILDANGPDTPEKARERQKAQKEAIADTPWYTKIYGVGKEEALKKKGYDSDQISELTGKNSLADLEAQKENMEITLGSRKWMDKEDQAKYDKIVAEIDRKKKKSAAKNEPAGSVPKAPSNADVPPAPVPVPPASGKLNTVSDKNNDMKLEESMSRDDDTSKTITNNNIINNKNQSKITNKTLPAVRNMEETFQRMIYSSTRVV